MKKLMTSLRVPVVAFLVMTSIILMSLNTSPSKYTLYVFEGSDWCRICLKLEKTVLSTDAFQNFAKEREIDIVRLDFPQRKKLNSETIEFNNSIAEKYNFDGTFPTLVLVNNNAETTKKITYRNENLAEFLSLIMNTISENP